MSEFPKGNLFIRNVYFFSAHTNTHSDNPDVRNSRLISAAPDMYDELYDTLQLLKGKSSYDGDEFSIQARSIQELLNHINGKENNE